MRTVFPRVLLGVGLLMMAIAAVTLSGVFDSRGQRDSGLNVELGGPFTLTGPEGRPVSADSFPGKLLLIFFGYRYCPDVCPTGLQAMASALDTLGPASEAIQPLLISVDPERDTPAGLAEYVTLFHPRLIGLTGSPDQIATVARLFRAYYRRAPGGDAESYTVDHSAYTYLTDGRGRALTVFAHNTPPAEMATKIRAFLDRARP